MYVQSDPRSSLQGSAAQKDAVARTSYFGSQTGLFYREDPQVSDANGDTWISRGQNFVVVYSNGKEGGTFSRETQPDEYALIIPDRETSVEITTAEGSTIVPGYSVAFVPPGASSIRLLTSGTIVRLFTPKSEDLAKAASNADAFNGPHPNVPPFEAWPEPPGGLKLKWYTLDVPEDPSRFGRIYRCTTFMINYLTPRIGPRERDKVSPHHHDDFEQCSLALSGSFTHHLRWPWATNMNIWREDEHLYCESPSICVIPPPAIHTTTAESAGVNQLVDIFAPPRADFSAKPGWVLNEDDYPLPES
ncbi:Hypothetical protein RG1141_PA14190 (plasmid) [Neorhizobium galegae bv. officinalis bv. officinalis str. HAMBI 1141]|uniref:5-deoxy-glucuronate isomerase n=1 Tax=Neorhizobium galegae bv. officinalis bv. officinalis str. HAMBI 1141 TaxID=1028801 RepID=A0A068TJK5_NEOGA|nr:hypothetical protein [Neorhizobium galegae]CDN58251.1 Hypothetical protein RG1141_PA14190 [Neorhizobium galegae bv. officinalis bv. officinalis str. HAMBI 1141]